MQKAREREIVRKAADFLGERWEATPLEKPDFLISTSHLSFGLEVTQVFVGETNRKGSKSRVDEKNNDDWMAAVRRGYEARSDAKLHVRYSGAMTDAAKHEILNTLLAGDYDQRDLLAGGRFPLSDGVLHVTNEYVSRWYLIGDRVGWVSREPRYLQDVVDRKAKKIDSYRASHPEVRLLAYVDRRMNSGRLALDENSEINLRGFSVIYFLADPLDMLRFSAAGCKRFVQGCR